MTAGRRDTLVAIETATTANDDYNEPQETWNEAGQEWAAIFYGRGDERRQAAMEQGQQAASFQMLANPLTMGVTVKDRLTVAGAVWDIVGIAPETPKRGEIEFTAVRAL